MKQVGNPGNQLFKSIRDPSTKEIYYLFQWKEAFRTQKLKKPVYSVVSTRFFKEKDTGARRFYKHPIQHTPENQTQEGPSSTLSRKDTSGHILYYRMTTEDLGQHSRQLERTLFLQLSYLHSIFFPIATGPNLQKNPQREE